MRAFTAILAAFWSTRDPFTSNWLCACVPLDLTKCWLNWGSLCPRAECTASSLTCRLQHGGSAAPADICLSREAIAPTVTFPPRCAHGWGAAMCGDTCTGGSGWWAPMKVKFGLCWQTYTLSSKGRWKRSHNIPWNTPIPHACLDDSLPLSQILLVSLCAIPRSETACFWNRSSNKLPKVAQAGVTRCTGEQPLARQTGPDLGRCGSHPWKHFLPYPSLILHPNRIHPSLPTIPHAVVHRMDQTQFWSLKMLPT